MDGWRGKERDEMEWGESDDWNMVIEKSSVKHEGQKKESAAVMVRGRDKGEQEQEITDGAMEQGMKE